MKNFQNKLVDKNIKKDVKHVPSVEEYMTKNLITFKDQIIIRQ